MVNTWYTNIEHFLDQDGLPAIDIPRRAELLLDYLGSIIEAVTSRNNKNGIETTDVQCRRRPQHRRCVGRIIAALHEDDPGTIRWMCPVCPDKGFISGWQGSIWDETKDT